MGIMLCLIAVFIWIPRMETTRFNGWRKCVFKLYNSIKTRCVRNI